MPQQHLWQLVYGVNNYKVDGELSSLHLRVSYSLVSQQQQQHKHHHQQQLVNWEGEPK
jgi:hypothetical protein